jgi:hypothetical protein
MSCNALHTYFESKLLPVAVSMYCNYYSLNSAIISLRKLAHIWIANSTVLQFWRVNTIKKGTERRGKKRACKIKSIKMKFFRRISRRKRMEKDYLPLLGSVFDWWFMQKRLHDFCLSVVIKKLRVMFNMCPSCRMELVHWLPWCLLKHYTMKTDIEVDAWIQKE